MRAQGCALMIPGVPPGYQWSVATEVVDVFSDVVNVVFWD